MPEMVALCAKGIAVPVCPEVDGGLPVPRPPCELRSGRAVAASGEDMTMQYLRGAEHARNTALRLGIRLAVLKEKSPSCGSSCVYDGTFSRRLVPGEGLAARALREVGVRVVSEADKNALNQALRDAGIAMQ